mgnify:CR=1 FL=1
MRPSNRIGAFLFDFISFVLVVELVGGLMDYFLFNTPWHFNFLRLVGWAIAGAVWSGLRAVFLPRS